jgi:hypothetical protein
MKNGEFTLKSGRTLRLDSLRQWAVYSGLLEGLPTRERNDAMLEGLRTEARGRDGHEPYLIEPTQTPIEYEGKYPFGEPAALPPICCVAHFSSDALDALHYTCLSVIWFQHDYAFPISAEVEAELSSLNWGKLAERREV